MNHLFKKFKSDILGLWWLAIGLFIALALVSYHTSDPSFNSTGSGHQVINYCGYFGSFLADLLYQFLGISAWLVVALAFRRSLLCFWRKEEAIGKRTRWIWSGLFFITSASLIGLYFPETSVFSQQVSAAGLVGMMVSRGLVKIFNFAGVAVILWTAAAIFLVFYTERTIKELLKSLWNLMRGAFSSLMEIWFKLIHLLPRLGSSGSNKMSFTEPHPILSEPEAKSALPLTALKASRNLTFLLRREKKNSDPSIAEKGSQELTPSRFRVVQSESSESNGGGTEGNRDPILSGFLMKKGEEARNKNSWRKKAVDRVENWELPKLSILTDAPISGNRFDEKEIKVKAKILVDKLGQFSVRGNVVGIKPGPAITLFEFKPAADVKISKITDLADDLSLALSSESVRIIAPIPGRDVVGIETSNPHQETVFLKDILLQDEFWAEEMKLPIALGRQADGEPKVVDLRKMPHLLVAGSTGSGKSVFIVGLIAGLLFKHSPKTLRMILVDPKQVDLAAFGHCPHLIMPPVRETQKAVGALKWAIREMEKRYRSMSRFGARGLERFNEIVSQLTQEEREHHQKAQSQREGDSRLDDYYFEVQPYIVIVVEEFGDLMSVDKSNVENVVVRLAQMARACGIHLILAMQSPRRDVVTGLIKTNIPGRVSFKVASKMDSRIILDESGAERLLTRGDMLYLAPGVAKPERHHGAYLSEAELNLVTEHWACQGEPEFDSLALRMLEGNGGGFDLLGDSNVDNGDSEYDDRYDEILAYVASLKEISASLIQRRFRIGYPRAARLIEMFEAEGVVGPSSGSKPRQVLVGALNK